MKSKRLVSLLLALSIIFSTFAVLGSISALAAPITATVSAFNASANSGQIDSTCPDNFYWKTEFVSGNNGSPWTTLRFKNKATGLYLVETANGLAQTSDKDDANTLFQIGDFYGNKWVLYSPSSKYVGIDTLITNMGPSGDGSGNHASNGTFDCEGYELVRFSDDGSYKTADTLADDTAYVIYVKSQWGDWMESALKGDDVPAPEEPPTTATVSAFNASANSGQIDSTCPDNFYWKTEFVSGNNGSPWTTLRFKNKATGLYLVETANGLAQTSDKDDENTLFQIGDFYGNKWVLYSPSGKYVGIDTLITNMGPLGDGSGNHASNGTFDSEGYELVRFSDDGSYKTADTLADNTAYVIYIKSQWGDWMESALKGDDVPAPEEPPTTATVSAFNASANSGQIDSTCPDNFYWKTEFVSGNNGSPWTTLRFKNKATGLYLVETANGLAQTSDKDDANTLFQIGDFYGNKWVLYSPSSKYVGIDTLITNMGPSGDGSGNHASNGTFDCEGYELVRFSDDGSYKTADTLADNTAYVIYVKSQWGDWMESALKGDNVASQEPPATTTLDAAAGDLPTDAAAKEYYTWTAVVSGAAQTGTNMNEEGRYYFVNKATGLYLTDNNGTLVVSTKDNAAAQVWTVKDFWTNKFLVLSSLGNYLNSDSNMTEIRPMGETDQVLGGMADNVNSANGYELINILSAATGEIITNIADGTEVYIRDWVVSGFPTEYLGCKDPDAPDTPPVTLPEIVAPENAAAVTTTTHSVEDNGMPTTDADNFRWTAITTDGGWVFKNVANGYVLTDGNGTLTAQTYTGEPYQTWVVTDNWGYLWKMYNKRTNKYINTDYDLTLLGLNGPSDDDHASDGINNIEWYEMVHFTTDGQTEVTTLKNGETYYIYNVADGSTGEIKDVLGVTATSITPTLPGTADNETLMDGQDTANPPVDVAVTMGVKVSPLAGIAKKGTQIWIFQSVVLDNPVEGIWNVVGNTDSIFPTISTGYYIQNKETGLYLTQINHKVYQTAYTGADNQKWTFEQYPFGMADDCNILRNYEDGYQLLLEDTTVGLYNPKNHTTDPDVQATWPTYGEMQFNPLTGAATVSLARVMANVGDKKARFPEDGKGYYIYVFDNGYGGGLLEAVAETVVDHTTDIPTIEKGQYSKDITYIADLDAGIAQDDLNWDLLYDAYSDNGVIYGTATNESGIYGVGFRHATYGRGKSEISFKLTIPDYVTEYVSVAMRLNSYHDLAVDQTGIRVYINSKGEIGLKFSGTSQDLTTRATGFSFAEGRNVYITDDAENNVITVYFDDNGTRVKVAEVAINRGTATLTPADTTLTAVTKNYGYNIYTDGYISITTDGADVLIGELMATVQTFSNKAFARAVDTIVGGGSTPEEDKEAEKDPSDSSTPSTPSTPSDTSKPSTPPDTSKPAAPSDTASKPTTTVTPDADDTSSDNSSDVDSDADADVDTDKDDTDKDDTDKDDTDKNANVNADDAPQGSGTNLWLIVAILGGAVLLGTFIVIFALKSTKKKEA